MAEYCWIVEEIGSRKRQPGEPGLGIGWELTTLLHDGWEPMTSVPSIHDGEVFLLMRRG